MARRLVVIGLVMGASTGLLPPTAMAQTGQPAGESRGAYDPSDEVRKANADLKVGAGDCPQWGASPIRNNVHAPAATVPLEFDSTTGQNILWSVKLGSETYGNPVVANGQVYVGTNNGAGYLERYPSTTDLGVLLCFSEKDGTFLWQHSSEKLPTGRVHDWPDQGICSAPLVDGDRLWYVTSRGEVVCLDAEGFHDGENDGPVQDETHPKPNEADVVWRLNMMKQLGVSQHNMCSCSVTCAGDFLFVNTSNGVDEGHVNLPAETAPSFICVNRRSGEVVWTDNAPGKNVLHGQWSSPTFAVLNGQPQILFGAGDGWLYSFLAEGVNGRSKLLWKFDCNPKTSRYRLGGSATRNHIIGTPVVYDGLVFVAVGEDPEHGEGEGHLWCIDPSKTGDVSPTLVFHSSDPETPIAHKRLQACVPEEGDFERPNPNSAAVWHYRGNDPQEFETEMHRTCGSAAVKDDLLFMADFSGLFHCVDVRTGKAHWTYDMKAASWSSPLIVGDRVYVGNEDGLVYVFRVAREMQLLAENNLESAVYTTPIVANGVLYIANRNRLFAIREGAQVNPESGNAD